MAFFMISENQSKNHYYDDGHVYIIMVYKKSFQQVIKLVYRGIIHIDLEYKIQNRTGIVYVLNI